MIIAARDIEKNYQVAGRKLDVLKGINVTIGQGEFAVIVGPSGAGKSTLLHILGGLDAPNRGEVLWGQENFYQLKDHVQAQRRNSNTGFVFQFYHLLAEFDALENVLIPSLIKGDNNDIKKHKARGCELLERVGLGSRIYHRPQQLSGGEQQRVAIARALMNSPKVILCDEPTGNLDSSTGEDILNLLSELNRQGAQTLVIVTHDERIASKAQRVIHMQDGRIVQENTASVFNNH